MGGMDAVVRGQLQIPDGYTVVVIGTMILQRSVKSEHQMASLLFAGGGSVNVLAQLLL